MELNAISSSHSDFAFPLNRLELHLLNNPKATNKPELTNFQPSKIIQLEMKNSPANLDKFVEEIENSNQIINRSYNVKFSIDSDSGRMKASLIDRKTKEIIREIPPEKVLRIMNKLRENMNHLIDRRI